MRILNRLRRPAEPPRVLTDDERKLEDIRSRLRWLYEEHDNSFGVVLANGRDAAYLPALPASERKWIDDALRDAQREYDEIKARIDSAGAQS